MYSEKEQAAEMRQMFCINVHENIKTKVRENTKYQSRGTNGQTGSKSITFFKNKRIIAPIKEADYTNI